MMWKRIKYQVSSIKRFLRASLEGFTLLEMLVAIGLFSVVVSIAVGGFTRALRTQRHLQLLLSVNSNVSQALEVMAREIRTGVEFNIEPGDRPNYRFKNAREETVFYEWREDLGELWRTKLVSLSKLNTVRVGGKITSDNVRITNAIFSVQGTGKSGATRGSDDGFPPRITIALRAEASSTDPSLNGIGVSLQTTVSARLMDDLPPTLQVRKKVDNNKGGSSTEGQFTMAVVGYKVRPCLSPEAYAGTQSSLTTEAQKKLAEDIRKELTREPNHEKNLKGDEIDPLGGVCRNFIKDPVPPPDICLFSGSQKGSVVTLAKGQYCVDERPLGNYQKRFEQDCKGEMTGDMGAIKVNDVKICDVYNTGQPTN